MLNFIKYFLEKIPSLSHYITKEKKEKKKISTPTSPTAPSPHHQRNNSLKNKKKPTFLPPNFSLPYHPRKQSLGLVSIPKKNSPLSIPFKKIPLVKRDGITLSSLHQKKPF
jgi:hypothetical protein